MFRPSLLAASIGFFALTPLGAAFACGFAEGGTTPGCPSCAPPPCQTCNLPTTHQVVIPGVTVSPPSINVGSPTLGCDTCNFSNNGGGFGSVSVVINVNQTAQAVANGSAQASTLSNAAAANLITGGGGGGGGFSDSGPSTSITNLTVISNDQPAPPPMQSRQVCIAQKAVIAVYAVQAVCLDDKSTPHPASQTNADRDIADGFRGEVFRCIAGSHMQYTISNYAGGQANFDHGQTKVCAKNDSLWREADGSIACRPQTPARDCNERSLLRRYGAGIKVLKVAGGQVCAAYRTETIAGVAAPVPEGAVVGQSFAGNGGVGW